MERSLNLGRVSIPLAAGVGKKSASLIRPCPASVVLPLIRFRLGYAAQYWGDSAAQAQGLPAFLSAMAAPWTLRESSWAPHHQFNGREASRNVYQQIVVQRNGTLQ